MSSDDKALLHTKNGARLPIPRDQWDRAPYNRWTFQHIREMVPTVEVWRGNGPVREFEQRETNLDALQVQGIDRKPTTLIKLLDDLYTDGFIVLHQGAIIFERYLNDMNQRTLHLSQSVAKSIVGMAAGILVGQGLLDPKNQISHYLPELAEGAWAGATLQQVLDMTSGDRFDEAYTNPNSDMGQLDVASGWKSIPADADPNFKWPTDVWQQILNLKQQTRPHGEAFEYRSIETDILAFCMERVTGKRLAQIVSEVLWQKLGVEESASFTVDPAGYALADGGFNSTLRDYARFGQMILEGGQGVVPKTWIDETRNANHSMFGEPYKSVLPEGGYHNQFWIDDSVSRNLMCRGVFGQLIYIDFTNDMVVVKLASQPEFLSAKMMGASLAAIHKITHHLSA
jgi:CubicO group peptidase (beta-lactamase class C family)